MTTDAKPIALTDDSFRTEIEDSDGLAMVDFWAEWCGPCRIVNPIVEELAAEYEGRIKVGKVDVDEAQETAQRLNVRSIPSILFFKDGEHVDTVIGAVPKEELESRIEKHL